MNIYLYDRMADVEAIAEEAHFERETVRAIDKWYKQFKDRVQCNKLVTDVRVRGGFQDIPETVYKDFANNIDITFCNLLRFLVDNHIRYNAISLHRMWNKLKAMGQHHILTYLRFRDIQHYAETLLGSDLLRLCYKGASSLQDYTKELDDTNKLVANMREHIGCSSTADIKSSYKKWVAAHHPDKGGDVGKFVLVNACYEELKTVGYFNENKDSE